MTPQQRERDKKRVRAKVKVNKATGCWEWQGKRIKGYGYAQRGDWRKGEKRYLSAHRFAFRLWRGEIPEGLVLDHLCMNRACCNPWHLDPCTQVENMKRLWAYRKRIGWKPPQRKKTQQKKAA